MSRCAEALEDAPVSETAGERCANEGADQRDQVVSVDPDCDVLSITDGPPGLELDRVEVSLVAHAWTLPIAVSRVLGE